MQPELAEFLARHTPGVEEAAVWGEGTLPLRIKSYLSAEYPPRDYITSVRSLVFRHDAILVLRNQHSTHIVPGGRCEAGETLEQTLRREVLEETGWTIGEIALLGFMHFCHLGAKPVGYAYPFPDFVQLVYMADAVRLDPAARLVDDYELEARLRPIAEARGLARTPAEQLYLQTALKLRGGG
jgi:ADP-ribose pyrophosphatase YjhB (NUDIX family)